MYQVPNKLKTLYRHWEAHTRYASTDVAVDLDLDVLAQIQEFASERMHIWHKWQEKVEPPFTDDEILRKYRFCNTYRELDRQTIEIHELLNPLRDDFPLWLLNIAFCRFVCNPHTIKAVGLLSFDDDNNDAVYEQLRALPKPKYGSAYLFPISVIQKSETPTRETFFCFHLPKVVGNVADAVQSFDNTSVVDGLERILPSFGFNFYFHWTEILIDVAYQFPQYIDLFAKFPIGPGSLPTMQMLNKDARPEDVCLALTGTAIEFPYLTYDGKPVLLSAENWEGVGCEFRKYTNLKNGKGRRRIYQQK